jgi:hypothetical protein
MLESVIRMSLWIGATSIVAVGAIFIGNDRYDDAAGALAKACSGSAPSHQLDNALFNARALSDSGADPICAPAANDDDFDGLMLSRLPSATAERGSTRR